MSHCVPNIDVRTSDADDPSPSEKGEVASLFFYDQGGANYSSARKRAGACAPDGVVSHVPWMETESEEKRANGFEMSRESVLAIDVPLGHTPFQEDEMLSWLQYPLDDTLSKSYCSEQHCEQAFISSPFQNLLQGVTGEKLSASSLSTKLFEKSDCNIGFQSASMDAALALGAQRAAGLVPQAGAEVFDRVHMTRQSCNEASTSKATDTARTDNAIVNQSALEHTGKQNTMNFPFFSQQVAAAMKSSVQILGTSTGRLSIKDRLRQPLITLSNERMSIVEQSTSAACLTSLSPLEESGLNEVEQGTDTTALESLDPVRGDDKAGQAEVELNAYSAAMGTEFFETRDVTLTSLTGESDYSTGKSAKDVSCKRKLCPAEGSECESKDTGGVASQEIGPTIAPSISVKRTRAAEVHNQSERRRRNKINEKMKALQELIPNANKTDKASMLDEAIEYVKMLQAQLQLMSVRTGMIVPPIMMPPGMQYLSLQQRPNTAHMNMGRGLSRGFGLGMMDASTSGLRASPKPVFLGQPLPGHVYHHMDGYSPHGSPAVHEVQSHVQLNTMRNAPIFKQLQPVHMQRTNNIYKDNSDLGKQQQG